MTAAADSPKKERGKGARHPQPIGGRSGPSLAASAWARRDWLFLLGLIAAVFLAYQPVWRAGFIWNDSDYVTRPELRSAHGLVRIWSDVGATEQYYPVLHSAFWLEHRLWGDAAAGYHLANILLHAGSACLLVLILRRLAIPGAWLAGFVFGVHPVFVESVAWIAEQKNTLSTLFYLAAALTYLHFDGRRRPSLYLFALGLFVMALLSKSVTATLPAALLVIFWWQRGRLSGRGDVAPLSPWIVLGAGMGLFTAWVERRFVGAEGAEFELTLLERCLLAGRIIWFYLGKLLWPADLIFIYPRWQVSGGDAWQYLFPLGAMALGIGLWLLRRKMRGPLAAFLLFIGSLFPVLGFFNVYGFIFSFVADHWQYMTSLGIIVLVSAGLTLAMQRSAWARKHRAGPALAVMLTGLLGILNWRQSRMYNDIETFYRTTIEKNPTCWMARINLGNMLLGDDRYDEAIAQYEAALQVKPGFAKAHFDLGTALARQGRLPEAIGQFERAVQLKPDYAKAHHNLGSALAQQGRLGEAIRHFEQAVRLMPDNAYARCNLGTVLLELGRVKEARECYEQALRLNPDYGEAEETTGSHPAVTGAVSARRPIR